jgi:cytochrome oxidase Cu insertion factor (SCO1/SenC/PrrC family)
MIDPAGWNRDTPEETFAVFVDLVKRSPERANELIDLLPERHPVYAGRSTNATMRMRGYLLAAFEGVGLPDAVVPFVLEELENGRDAYLVAAAAMALRGSTEPVETYAPFLVSAIRNIRFKDDAVSFTEYKPRWPVSTSTTAMDEIVRTLSWMGPGARQVVSTLESLLRQRFAGSERSKQGLAQIVATLHAQGEQTTTCCGGTIVQAEAAVPRSETSPNALPGEIPLEDQAGNRLRAGDFFRERPTVVVFFYTRCDNPNKCSLTITKLAQLQQAIAWAGPVGQLQTAAITYDPAYDLAPRLRGYGENRGINFDERNRFFRAVAGFDQLQEFFALGVNYGPALVNRHRIELFLVDGNGRLVNEFTRLQWNVDEVLAAATALLDQTATPSPALQPRRIGLAMATNDARVAGGDCGCCAGVRLTPREMASSE